MKLNKILLAGVLLMLPLLCHAQKNIFNTYNDMKGVSSVYISKAMIEMNSNLFTKDIYIGKVSGQLDCVQILSTMDNIVKKDMRKDLRTLVQASKYEQQKGNVSSSEFYINRKGDKVKELIMIIDGAATLKFIYLVGEMTLKDIQNIMMYQNTSMNEGGSIYYIDGNSTLGSADIWGGLKGLEELKGLEGLENLKNLEGLKGLESLKDITKLKDSEYLKKRMNADQWKRFEKSMEMLEERFKNWE